MAGERERREQDLLGEMGDVEVASDRERRPARDDAMRLFDDRFVCCCEDFDQK